MQQNKTKLLKDIETALKIKGERFTPPRRQVMSALLSGKAPQTAYEIVEKIKDLKPMSVYRALDFLAAQGLAHRIESLNSYVACAENHCAHKDSQYLICDSCGKVEELHNHDIDNFISKTLTRAGFHTARKTMEIHGTCGRCAL